MKFKINKSSSFVFIFLLLQSASSFAEAANSVGTHEKVWKYVVLKNDSLAGIHQKYCAKGTNISELVTLNHLRNPNLLRPQQLIYIPVALLKTIPAPIETLVLNGDVRIQKSEAHESIKLNKTDIITAGNVIETGKNSVVKLRFADGSVTNIQPNSRLKIESSHQFAGQQSYLIRLKLSEGRTEVVANPQHIEDNQLEVETPSAVAVVRGTQFRVGADNNAAVEETLEGRVVFVAEQNEVSVGQGFGSVTQKGQSPMPPQKLPDAPAVDALEKAFDESPVHFAFHSTQEGLTLIAQLALDDTFNQLVDEQRVVLSTSNQLKFDALTDGRYFLKLRMQDAQGLQSADATHTFSVKLLPMPPMLIAPEDAQSISPAPYLFSWSALPSSSGYVVQVASDADFNHILIERVVSYNAFQLAQPLPAGDYYWRVAEKSATSKQRFSKARKFTSSL